MNTPELLKYQYLWDGTQPGWVLIRINGSYVELSLKFETPGPSLQEMMAIRRTVSEFKSLPLQQVIAQLRGSTSYKLGRFESREARNIVAICSKEGLNVMQVVEDSTSFLPTNEITNRALLIDDDELAKRVYDLALKHGIPVRHVET